MRHRHTRTALSALCLLSGVGLAWTGLQPDAEVTTPLADHPVAEMIGMWRGTGSRLGRDGQWHEAVALERARWNLAGTAILVEGYGYEEDPATGERTVGHDAFGLIEFDEASGAARFHAHRAGDDFEMHPITVIDDDGTMQWSPPPPPGAQVRFTVTIKDGQWHEVGELSRDDGATWMAFLKTDLKRIDD